MTRQQIKIGLWVLAGLLWLAGLEIRGWGQQITLGTQTKGVLPVNQGGTNATDAAAARANIGAVGLSDSQTLSNKIITSPRVNDIRGYSNSLMTVLFGEAVGAANYVGIYQAATGSGPLIQALGTDANVDLRLRPQGSGALDLGAMTAIKITGCAAGDYLRIAGGNLASCDSGSGSGAPTAASYITRTAEAGLSNETALDSLSTGLLKNTAGVLSAATASDLPNHASRHNNGGADQIGIDGGQVISGLVADARIPTSLVGRTFTTGVSIDGTGTDGQNFLRIDESSSILPACVAGSAVLYSSLGQLEYCNGFSMTRQIVGNVFAPSATPGHVAYFTTSSTIQSHAAPDYAATPNTFALRDGQGALKTRQYEAIPTTDSVAGIFQRYNSSQTNYILEIRREDTARMAGVDKNFNWVGNVIGNITGNAATANALTSDPADCTPLNGFAWTIDSTGGLGCRAVNLASAADTTGQLAVSRLNVTGTPDASKVLYGDRWAAPPSGGGPVVYCSGVVGDGSTDDQAAIASCINSLPVTGGTVDLPCVSMGIGSTLEIGNGTLSAIGTRFGITLRGCGRGSDSHVISDANGQRGATKLKWVGAALSTKTISGATNTTPAQITVTGHGFTDSQQYVLVDQAGRNGGCSNDSGVNGVYQIRVVDANTLELRGSAGNGTYNGACPGTLYYGSPVVRIAGPTLNVRLEGIQIDGGAANSGGLTGTLSLAGPAAFTGLEVRHASNSSIKDIGVTRVAGVGFMFRTSNIAPIAFGNCHGYGVGMDYLLPQHQRSSGMVMTGYDAANGMDTCSWKFNDIKMAYGGGGGSFGVEEAFADNNSFLHLQLPKSTGGTGVDWRSTRQVTQTAFPQAQVCDRCYIASYGGTTGTGGGGKFLWLPNYGSQEIGGVIPSTLTAGTDVRGFNDMGQMWGMEALGLTITNGATIRYTGSDENAATAIIDNTNGGQNGAGRIYMRRAGTNIASIKAHYFDGIGLYVHDGGGTGTLREVFRGRTNGLFTPMSVSFSDLGGEPTGTFGYCSNCQVTSGADNTCASGGGGALAWKINSVWRCFATQN